MKKVLISFILIASLITFFSCSKDEDPKPKTLKELLAEGMEIKAILDQGFTVKELLDEGVSIPSLLDAGVTVKELLNAGISIPELISGGVTVQALLSANVTVIELLEANVPVKNLLVAGVSIGVLLSNNVSLHDLIVGEAKASELLAEGFTILELLKAATPQSNSDFYGQFVGLQFNGGLIFMITSDSHGELAEILVAANEDQSIGAEWGCYGVWTHTSSTSGVESTAIIESICLTPGTAADICANLVLETYSDWFLPDLAQLVL